LLCQAYLEYVDVMILRYERILKQTKEDLLEFMGEEVTTSMYVDLNFQLAIEKPFEPTNGFKDLIEKREEYINAVYNELFAHDEVQSAQAEFLPKLDLTATGSSTSSDLDFGHQKDWSLTLNLVLPLFSGGRSYSGLQEKNNQWLIKKIDKEMIYISTKKSLRDAFYKYDEAFVEYGISQTIIKARRLKTAITRERYRAGLSKFDSWDNAETDLFKEEYNLIAYYREALIAQVEWWHLSGKGFDHLWK
jgi:multidrug efflux system outer membrane protein